MKIFCLILLALALAATGFSQSPGIDINNCSGLLPQKAKISYAEGGPAKPGNIDGALHEIVGPSDWGGVNARVAAYACPQGADPSTMVLLPPAVGFRSGLAAGCMNCGQYTERIVPGVFTGQPISVQLRAWDAGMGGFNSYEEAAAYITAGHGGYLGVSAIVQVTPTIAPYSPPVLIGLQPFSILWNYPGSAPLISVQPASQTVPVGGTLRLTVQVSGMQTPVYQWYFNNSPLAGYTDATLTLTNVQFSNAGSYFVIVSTANGEITSQTAVVTIAPAIDVQMIPAVSIRGAIGQSYRIEYADAAGPTNLWQPVATIVQTNSQQYYFDVSAIGQPARFYRVVAAPSP